MISIQMSRRAPTVTVAIGRYDVVAYFTHNQAIRGSQENSATYDEVSYQFSRAENRSAFLWRRRTQSLPQIPRHSSYTTVDSCCFTTANMAIHR
jgi:hypothetical protein